MHNTSLSTKELSDQKRILRSRLRSERKSLSKLQQKRASDRLVQNLSRSLLLMRTRHVALYLASDGEIDISSLITSLNRRKFRTFVPVITDYKHKKMSFVKVTPRTTYAKNKYGIAEPKFSRKFFNAKLCLGLVILPMAGFDNDCRRLGMGGGFYDRFLDETKWPFSLKKPVVIGVAHELQKCDAVPSSEKDVAMNAIVTDKRIYRP